jgi:hypothetical protein
MDQTLARLRAIKWRYADKDPMARAEMAGKLAHAAKRESLLTYSELVSNIQFHLPNLKEGVRTIDPSEWEDIDRAIVGDFLGYLSLESFERGAFLVSALVIGKEDRLPGAGFFELMKDAGLIASSKSDKAMRLWSDHVQRAFDWYRTHSDEA